jgi:integrase
MEAQAGRQERQRRVKPGHALIDGKVVPVKDWTYDLRYTVDRKTAYLHVGDSAADADARRQQLEIKSSVKAQAKEAGIQVVETAESKTLKATAAAYIDNAVKRGANEAAEQARLVSEEFLRLVKVSKVDQVTQDDVFAYHQWLRKNQCGDRTVSNKHMRLASWLRFAGIDPKQIPPRPRYEEKLPDMYSSAQTSALLAAADPYMRMCILIALKCGLRDQELRHVEFRDIDWESKTLRVRAKPQWKFTVKTWEQREVPVTKNVLEALMEWQQKRPGQTLILGTKNQKPNTKLLRMLKHVAKYAGLNCGRCDPCLERKECEEFTLHRFRRTYITTLLRRRIDLRTVQAYAGHKDIASTMRYLTPQTATEAQDAINAIEW